MNRLTTVWRTRPSAHTTGGRTKIAGRSLLAVSVERSTAVSTLLFDVRTALAITA